MLMLATGYRQRDGLAHREVANVADCDTETTLATMKSHPDAIQIMVWQPGEDCESNWIRGFDGLWTTYN